MVPRRVMSLTVASGKTQRRGTELALVIFAVIVTLVCFTSVSAAYSDQLPSGLVEDGLGFAVLAIGTHLALRRLAPYADPLLLPAAVLLNGLGLVLIHRLDLAAQSRAHASHTSFTADAPLQLVWTIVGIAAFLGVLLLVRDHRVLESLTYTAMAVGLGLLVLPALLPARFSTVNGARIWIRFNGFSFQPGEIAKLALEVFFAGYLVRKREVLSLAGRKVLGMTLPRARDLGPVLVAWAASLLILTRESDLGSSLLFFGIFVTMLYVATARRSWLLIGVLLFALGSLIAYHFIGHVHERVQIWLHPLAPAYITNESYQLAQGLFGQATGGIFGTGLGQGRPDLVPFANTDFIASTIAEELGLAGLMAILCLYLIIVMRGLRAAIGTRDAFGKLLGVGLAFGLALQVFVQVGGVTRLIPLTGLTLPFLSYGGSSLISNWILLALLLRISDSARRPAPPVPAAAAENATMVVRR
ncbi:MAG TPA: FtsW/RodA/SpoVE family cell cycle protein [Mycobacteriales bacterium]|nr:FtsW/RodA/SpoVE family cell cycle protein [Mycobacteriales bacterium]